MSSVEPLIPEWVPCGNCGEDFQHHVDRKCPFESTEFGPDDKEVLAILYTVRRKLAVGPNKKADREVMTRTNVASLRAHYIFHLEIFTKEPKIWIAHAGSLTVKRR